MRKINLTFFFIFAVGYLFADNRGNAIDFSKWIEEEQLKSIKPIAPTAASLGTYGEYPVDFSNGLVPINIELYQIKCGSLSIPISLSYHGGGIKADQDASWVGLGWDLNFGGFITRTMNGNIDEHENYLAMPDAEKLSRQINEEDLTQYGYFYSLACHDNPQSTFKPDVFSYSIGGHSGTFLLSNDEKEVITTSYSPISGTLQKLCTPDGVSYFFNESEYTRVVGNQGGTISYYPSTYYVSKIISSNRADTIRYTYQKSGLYSKQNRSNYEGYYTFSDPNGKFTITPEIIKPNTTSCIANMVSTVKPSTIEFRGYRVRFVLSATEFINGNPNCKFLEKIIVESKTGESIKEVRFIYDGQKLKSVIEMNASPLLSASKTIATFEYYDESPKGGGYDHWKYYNGSILSSNGIPKTYLSGTYPVGSADRSPNEKYVKHNSLKKITYPTGGSTEFVWEINRVMSEEYSPINTSKQKTAVSRSIDTQRISHESKIFEEKSATIRSNMNQTVIVSYSMKKIDTNSLTHRKYDQISINIAGNIIRLGINESQKNGTFNLSIKAGTLYTISMEANCQNLQGNFSFDYYNLKEEDTKKGVPFAGLRIKNIIQRDENGSVLSRKCYEYLNPSGVCSGYVTSRYPISYTKMKTTFSRSTNAFDEWGGAGISNPLYSSTCNIMVCSDFVSGPQSNQYSYEYVSETVYDGKTGSPLTRTKYQFNKCYDVEIDVNAPTISKSHLRGQVIRKDVYSYIGNAFNLEKTTTNNYKIDRRVDKQKTGFIMYTNCAGNIATSTDYASIKYATNLASIFIPVNYTYTSDWVYLENSEEVVYTQNGIIKNRTVFEYGNQRHAMPTRTTIYSGDKSYYTEIQYSGDLKDSAMVNKNILIYPIVKKMYINNTLIGGVRNVFNDNMLCTAVMQILPSGKEVSLYKYKYNDLKHNYTLSELVGKDDMPTSIFWDKYNNNPVVIAQGIDADGLKLALGSILSNNIDFRTLYKNNAFKNVLLYTYTYDTKGNVISVTEPNGATNSFEYDGLSRLIIIRDIHNELINSFDYNYKKAIQE